MTSVYVNVHHVVYVEETDTYVQLVTTTEDIMVVEDIDKVLATLNSGYKFVSLTKFNPELVDEEDVSDQEVYE